MRIYKYISPRLAEDVVGNLTLRITQTGALNDPFEAYARFGRVASSFTARKYWRDKLGWEAMLQAAAQDRLPSALAKFVPVSALAWLRRLLPRAGEWPDVLLDHMNRKFAESRRSESLPRRIAEMLESAERSIRSQLDLLGVISFTKTPTSTLMWAHYGVSGTGFVTECDASHPFFRVTDLSAPLGRLQPVRYLTRLPLLGVLEVGSLIEEIRRSVALVYFDKLRQWSYEREYRLVLPLDNADLSKVAPDGDPLHLRRYPPEVLTGIVLGPRSSPALALALREQVRSRSDLAHVQLRRVTISPERQRPTMRDADWASLP